MNGQDPASILYDLVKSQIGRSSTLAEVETQVQVVAVAAGIPNAVVEDVLSRFRTEFQPPEEPSIAPRLLVDWGEPPRVGYQVRPEFSLVCSAYTSWPDVRVTLDRDLDHDPTDPARRPKNDAPGLWTFCVPFRMTSNGMDCRPGQYLLDVAVSFRDVPPEIPRFYGCRIRLQVPDRSDEQGCVLEIDGDGQSMVNLQGYSLNQFSKVVLSGGQDSVINLQNLLGTGDTPAAASSEAGKPATTFEYTLKVDSQKQSRLPTLSKVFRQRCYLDAAGFFFEDGRRTLLYARPWLTFGRNRDNDVVLRFLPPSAENDDHSRHISRTHFIAEGTVNGIEIRDESRSGIELNYSVVRDREVVPTDHTGEVTQIQLGVTGSVPRSFLLEMLAFGPDRFTQQDDLEFWQEVYSELVGGRVSRLGRQALSQRLDAIRFDRVENLPQEETYVLLLREALIGGVSSQSAIVLKESGPTVQARVLHLDRTFWLEPLSGASPPSVNGQTLPSHTLAPLSPGMEIRFGKEAVRFDRPAQLYLD